MKGGDGFLEIVSMMLRWDSPHLSPFPPLSPLPPASPATVIQIDQKTLSSKVIPLLTSSMKYMSSNEVGPYLKLSKEARDQGEHAKFRRDTLTQESSVVSPFKSWKVFYTILKLKISEPEGELFFSC